MHNAIDVCLRVLKEGNKNRHKSHKSFLLKGANTRTFEFFIVPGYDSCHCSRDMAVRMCELIATPRSCVL